ncbi:MAG: hypothetical protein IPP52_15860 [Ignavibacteria bacterium]|nr:hypothetical protein [Ignavibacteria bacterium]
MKKLKISGMKTGIKYFPGKIQILRMKEMLFSRGLSMDLQRMMHTDTVYQRQVM